MIEVKNLTKKYGDHIAIDKLSFCVEKGKIYGFLGPNGAGKSTTMNIITGYLAPSEGTVTINGKDIQREPEEAKRCIGYLPELPPLYADMTVMEYLSFAAELKRVPRTKRQEQLLKVMEMTHITDMQGRLIKNLSKGYKQRVGLAQAILGYPEVIILDEPTVGLDPKQIIEIRDLIRTLGEKHTVILSSHILSEISAVCDQIMIISHGKLVASDSPEGLKRRMSGEAELLLTVKTDNEAAAELLGGLAEVEKVEICGKDNEGCAKLAVLAKNGQDIRERVFYALAEARMPILSMQRQEKTLEDIFLELTAAETEEGSRKRHRQPEVNGEAYTEGQSGINVEADTEGQPEINVEADMGEQPEMNVEAYTKGQSEMNDEANIEAQEEGKDNAGNL